MRRSLVLCLLTLLPALPAAAQDQEPTTTLSLVFQDLYGPNGLVVNSNAGAARRVHALGALQQRVPVELHAVQRRARQPADIAAAAVAGLGLHVSLRCRDRHVRPIDAEFRPDPHRSRRDDRTRPLRVQLQLPVSSRSIGSKGSISRASRPSSRTTTFNSAAAAPTSSPRATPSTRPSVSGPAR